MQATGESFPFCWKASNGSNIGAMTLQGSSIIRTTLSFKYRCEGKLSGLEAIIDEAIIADAHIGLGHTRWATHGAPTTANAHPHADCSGRLVVVHNGIIENYHSLREELIAQGHLFTSETDTEVLAHLIEQYLQSDLVEAVRTALGRVEGSYALGVMSADYPGYAHCRPKPEPASARR